MQDPRRASYPGSQPVEPPSPAALLRLMRRRVPPEKRQRTEMSCDWCKKKRCKCLRGSSMDACRACSEVGRPCLTTEPRKRRVYGSLSSASGAGGGLTVSTGTTTSTESATASPTATAGTPSAAHHRSPTALSPPVLESITATVPESAPSPATPSITAMPIGQQPPSQKQQLQQPTPLSLEPGEELADPLQLLGGTPSAELLSGTDTVSPKKILLNLHHQQRQQFQQQQQHLLLLQQQQLQQQKKQQQQQQPADDERFLEDSMGFPRYIGTLGSRTLLSQLWDVMGMKCPAPLTGGVQQQQQSQPSQQSPLARSSSVSSASVGQGMRQCDGRGGRGIDLPPREVADVLVDLFFDKVHCDFPIFHRALFQAHYENMWAASASESPKPQQQQRSKNSSQRQQQQQQQLLLQELPAPSSTDPAWLMCLSMVFVLGLEVFSTVPSSCSPAQSAVRRLLGNASRREELQKKYLAKSQERLPDVLMGSRLLHVQALLLYCRYLHITRNRNACWNLTGVAIRMAIAIGLHRDGGNSTSANGGSNPLERELRRRVWWTLYAFEAMECSSLGRLSAIDHTACNVGLPNEGVLDMSGTMPLGCIAAQAELMKLLGSICRHQYGSLHEHREEEDALVEASAAEMAASTKTNGASSSAASSISSSSSASAMVAHDQVAFAQTMTVALDDWYARLPSNLRLHADSPRSHTRAILLLHIQYHYTVALLYRPFLLAMVTRKTSSSSDGTNGASASRWHEAEIAEALSSTTPPPSPSPLSSPVRFFAHKCIRSAKSAVRVLEQLFRLGQFNSKTWWDVYFIEAICMVLAMGRFVDDKELYNDTGIVDSLKTCLRILKECKEFSPTMQRFAVVTTDFAQSLITEATQAQQRQQHLQQQHLQQQQQQQQQQQLLLEEKSLFTQSPTPQTTPQPLLQDLPIPTQTAFQPDQFQQLQLQLQLQQSYFESDDLGDMAAASTAASQSVGSPDESFIPTMMSGHINPNDLTTSGPLMDTTYPFSSVSWNVPELSPFWGDVPQPDHWW